MNYTIAITHQLLEKVFQFHDEPELFFIQLMSQLRQACYPVNLSVRILGGSSELLQKYDNALSTFPELAVLSVALRDRLQRLKPRSLNMFDDCSIDYIYKTRNTSTNSTRQSVDFVLSSDILSLSQRQLPHHCFKVAWDECLDLKGIIKKTKNSNRILYCFDYDETLFSTSQGRASYNVDLINAMQDLVDKNSACILSARTDPVYLYHLIIKLLQNPLLFIKASMSKFDRDQCDALSSDVIWQLRERCKVVHAPIHRKQLISQLMQHLMEIISCYGHDKSPWEVEQIPEHTPMFFMNTNVQLIINECVAHLDKMLELKGEFARWFLNHNPTIKQVILVDDSEAQRQSWEAASKRRTRAFQVSQSLFCGIAPACQAVQQACLRKLAMRSTADFRGSPS